MTDAEILEAIRRLYDAAELDGPYRLIDALSAKFAAHERLRVAARDASEEFHNLGESTGSPRWEHWYQSLRAALSDSPAPKCEHKRSGGIIGLHYEWCPCGALFANGQWHTPGD